MDFYFAPLEGVTGHVYRNAHKAIFNSIDKYFAPFIVANQSESFTTRELNDLLPENNEGLVLIPQILTNNAKDFIHTSGKLERMGYKEVNLNLGCPSGTVVSKNRGSGFLSKREELNSFLEEIFSQQRIKISVKTRIGKDQPEEFYELLGMFNKYPMEELIIHPRVQKDYYKNSPNLKMFGEALGMSRNPVCYNGDIFTVRGFEEFAAAFPGAGKVMLGRGLIANPLLAGCIKNGAKLEKWMIIEFHDRIYEGYRKTLSGDRNVLFKMKEVWFYMVRIFSDNAKYAKKIRKSERLLDYENAVSSLFREQEVLDGWGYEN
jgi:tRNA-dihydrouridine synthase